MCGTARACMFLHASPETGCFTRLFPAHLGHAGGLELVLELVEGAEVALDGVSQLAGGLTTTVGLHGLPEEGVVPDLHSNAGNEGSGCVSLTFLEVPW